VIVVAHDSEPIREVIRRLLEGVGWSVVPVSDGHAAVAALTSAGAEPVGLVLDVAVGGLHAYAVVEEVRRQALPVRVVLVASVYNRTSYKRRPTSLYGADDYVEQHHIPDSLVQKLSKLLGPPPKRVAEAGPHEETAEDRLVRKAGEARLEAPAQEVLRAERLARLIVADIALYNGDALEKHFHGQSGRGDLEARLRRDLEEGRLLFDLRVPEEVRRGRDFIGEALAELEAEGREHSGDPK
jgi:CheY-like chemotaxis protein